jgi:malate dehydrogenase (oxaloacetate-decarboxylating)(NADP+)
MLAAMRRAAAAAAAAAPARAAAARAAAAAAARRLARFDPADADDPAGDATRPTTPWARQVISGVDLLRNAKFSKGLAFSPDERERLYLRGLLPPAVLSQATQAERVLANLRGLPGDVAKVGYLLSLQERNERLFYWVLRHHAAEAAPLLQHPAIGAYCAQYSLMFRSTPRGLYLALADKGHVFSILKNWPERRVKAICLTDGAAVGTQGDLGVQAACAPIARLAMLTAVGGVDPSTCLPVTLDAGTDNERLLVCGGCGVL